MRSSCFLYLITDFRKNFGIIINTVIIIEDFLAYSDICETLIIDFSNRYTNDTVKYVLALLSLSGQLQKTH